MSKLTPKQEKFCREYIIDLNATQAAIRAGYSKKTAQEIGSENLSKPMIANFLAQLQAPITKKALVDAEYVLTGLKHIADTMTANMIDVAEDGSKTVSPACAQAASRAHELLGKHLVLFSDKIVHEIIEDPLEDLNTTRDYLKEHGVDIDSITH